MNILTFKYTKADATASQRVLAVLIKPNTMYEGIDLSELEMLEQALFAEQFDKIQEEYLNKIHQLKGEFDVVNNYRRFDTNKMTDIVSEQI